MKVYCCPFAGAGASIYREWSPPPGSGVELQPLQFPGREEQFDLAALDTVPALVAHALAQVRETAAPGEELVLFGHSSGAVVALELARTIAESGEFRVAHLVVSGAPDPFTPLDLGLRGLSDGEFVRSVEKIAGFSHPALAQPELREILLPPLRADMLARDDYVAPADAPLPVPITAIRGEHDQLVSPESLAAWQNATSAGCTVTELPGEHMYFLADPSPLLRLLAETITRTTAEAAR
ncbi:thioesterase II family protein [Amycolatopsis sp. CA-230715]|uniref:thioesterase II family protein n=1 Tax=Amycolatopsis sp. CA-230715 TaxID=2745196 RepID=UPI001C33D008|nr:alpha/beta fold hydrolase [Amycolatopsis sp. CA-230715]QWF85108.1 Thioesterase PikA5 [Amycolatopsis sp. CA-230715]